MTDPRRACLVFPFQLFLAGIMISVAVAAVGCGSKPDDGADPEVTSLGTVEVTAQLLEIRGEFPSNDLYDYAYILKYEVLEVHRGENPGSEIMIAQYNPLKPRAEAEDEFSGPVGGNLKRFRAGEKHRMALEVPLDDHYMGALVDKYFEEKKEILARGEQIPPTYWAVWTNLVTD